MKYIKLFEDFVYLPHIFWMDESETASAKTIAQYIQDVTPSSSDVPDYFINQILKSNDTFELKPVKIEDLMKSDDALADYIRSGEERYGKDSESGDHEPQEHELRNPIVVWKGEVLDGYSRTSTLYHQGEKYVEAWISK